MQEDVSLLLNETKEENWRKILSFSIPVCDQVKVLYLKLQVIYLFLEINCSER